MGTGLREHAQTALNDGVGPVDGIVAALPLAAAGTLALARVLPVSFTYHPNALGIVSIATEQRYPVQQETFWLLFALGTGTLLTGLLGRALARPSPTLLAVVGAEALGLASLLAALWLPGLLATLAWIGATAAAVALARRSASASRVVARAPQPARTRMPPPARAAIWIVALLLFPLLLSPGLWPGAWNVAHGVEDLRLTADTFRFQAEKGQHLAWATAMEAGGLHGRDFFCLYGPLFHYGLLGLWRALGRSIAAFDLYWSMTGALAWLALLGLGGSLLRRRAFALLLPFMIPVIRLRVGLPLLGLWLLQRWLRSDSPPVAALAGIVTGASLVYSQEFGVALALPAAFALWVRGDLRSAAAFIGGGSVAMLAVLTPFLMGGALGAMLEDLLGYPRLMMAGFAKLPFPALVPALPLTLADFDDRAGLHLRLGYSAAAICLAGLLLALPLSSFDPRRPIHSLAGMRARLAREPDRLAIVLVAAFGLISFRSALGRSDLLRTLTALPAPALLVCVALDRSLSWLRRGGPGVGLGVWRLTALGVLVLHAGLFEEAAPMRLAQTSLRNAFVLFERGHAPRGSERVAEVVRFVKLSTRADDAVLFLPNNAAYYYLTERRNPIRFALVSQIITDAHRAEVHADLLRDPPRYVLWDTRAMNIDGVPEAVSLGPEVMDWLEQGYQEERQIRGVRVLSRRPTRAVP